MKYVPMSKWGSHPILSRLSYRSDFDGDGTFRLDNYNASELDVCKSIVVESSQDGGDTWQRASFSETIIYIDSVGSGWYLMASYNPIQELYPATKGKNTPLVRAVLSE
tara:strand:- start:297 stop:620 length:324 start_codon:yes stop_codon:yes gene_type:complete